MKHHITIELNAATPAAALHALNLHGRAGRIGEFVLKVKSFPPNPKTARQQNPLLRKSRR